MLESVSQSRAGVPRLRFFNLGGGPRVVGAEVGFTEGGLVHAVRAMSPLALEYDVTVVCPNVPAGESVARDVTMRGVRVISPEPPHAVRWMRSGEMSVAERPLWTLVNWPSILAGYVAQSRSLSREHVDVVLANGIVAACLAGFAPGPHVRIAVIHHLYHDPWTTGSANAPAGLLSCCERFLFRHLKADAVAVVNPSVAACLTAQGFPPERVCFVGNGVDTEEYAFSTQRSTDSLVFVGRLRAAKGVEAVLDAFAIVLRRRPAAVLHIVGDGLLRSQLRARAERLGVAGSVVFHGFVAEDTKVRLLQSACLYLSASRFEGFGLPVAEAMACGAVPVVSNIPAHRYIFQGRDAGCLTSSAEEMAACALQLMQNEERRAALALAGRELVCSTWTWERVAARYRELIEALLYTRRG